MFKSIIFWIATIGVIHELFYCLRFFQLLFQLLYLFSIRKICLCCLALCFSQFLIQHPNIFLNILTIQTLYVSLIILYNIPYKAMNGRYMKNRAVIQAIDNLISSSIRKCDDSHIFALQ